MRFLLGVIGYFRSKLVKLTSRSFETLKTSNFCLVSTSRSRVLSSPSFAWSPSLNPPTEPSKTTENFTLAEVQKSSSASSPIENSNSTLESTLSSRITTLENLYTHKSTPSPPTQKYSTEQSNNTSSSTKTTDFKSSSAIQVQTMFISVIFCTFLLL